MITDAERVDYTRRRSDLMDQVRILSRQQDEWAKQAPNPRDFPNWDAFYTAQATHDGMAAARQRQIDDLTSRVFNLDDILAVKA